MDPGQLVGALAGGCFGLAADRLAARWPAHAGSSTRGLDWRTAAVTLSGGASAAAFAGRWQGPDLLVLAVYLGVLLVLLATDLDQRLLPDLLTLPLIGYAAVLVLLGWDPLLAGKELALVSAVAAGVGAPVLLLVTDRVFGGALGMGDVKLAVALGLMSGASRLFAGFLIASVAAAALLLVLIALRRVTLRSAVPFGPILIGAGAVGALLA
jgi:leader peptidase (prepilin peptidase)/N-methyltransferase